jgi:hypothetical protein
MVTAADGMVSRMLAGRLVRRCAAAATVPPPTAQPHGQFIPAEATAGESPEFPRSSVMVSSPLIH